MHWFIVISLVRVKKTGWCWGCYDPCIEYVRNIGMKSQTRNAGCWAALNVSPQQQASTAKSRVFHVPPKYHNFIMYFCS